MKIFRKETATLFKELDNIGLLCELSRQVDRIKQMGIIEVYEI